MDALLSRFDSGVLLDSFEAEDMIRGAQRLRVRMDDADHADRSRRAAETLSLTAVGVPRYAALYSRVATMDEPGRQAAKEILTDRLGNVFNARPIACPICGMRNLKTLGKRGGDLQRSGLGVETDIVSCRTCSLIFPDPFPFPADPQKLYADPDTYFASHDTDRSRRGHRALIARSIALAGMPSPRILDIGCGRGDLLNEARSMGIECAMGLDFAASMVEFARQHFAIDVSHMTAEEFADSDPEPFDIVFLNAVIEHVYDPGALLASVARLTRPGGDPHDRHAARAQPRHHGWQRHTAPNALIGGVQPVPDVAPVSRLRIQPEVPASAACSPWLRARGSQVSHRQSGGPADTGRPRSRYGLGGDAGDSARQRLGACHEHGRLGSPTPVTTTTPACVGRPPG